MGTQENKQLVIEGYRLFQSGDIRKLLDLYHDDAEWTGPELEFVPFSGAYHGRAGIAEFFAKLDGSVRTERFEPQQFIAEGDKVVVTGVATWLAKPTGRSYDSEWVHVFTVRNGKVARFDMYYDTATTEKAFHPEQVSQDAKGARLHH